MIVAATRRAVRLKCAHRDRRRQAVRGQIHRSIHPSIHPAKGVFLRCARQASRIWRRRRRGWFSHCVVKCSNDARSERSGAAIEFASPAGARAEVARQSGRPQHGPSHGSRVNRSRVNRSRVVGSARQGGRRKPALRQTGVDDLSVEKAEVPHGGEQSRRNYPGEFVRTYHYHYHYHYHWAGR
jgi:hypothetical protein